MQVWLVGGVRTPFCKAGTALDGVPAEELGRIVLAELLARAELPAGAVDAVVAGTVANPMEAANIARVVALRAGLADATPAHTVSRNCASGMEAAVDAARRIAAGEARLVAALGIESMSRIPLVFSEAVRMAAGRARRVRGPLGRLRAWGRLRPADLRPVPALLQGLTDPVSGLSMGETAEVLAREFGIPRERQDRFALRSHERAVRAARAGVFAGEIVPVFALPDLARPVAADVGPRDGQTLEKLGRLAPAFQRDGGTVTAGNSSMITDGAVALLLAEPARARELGLRPLARIRSHAVVGLAPARMGLGPAFAVPLALDRAGISLGDVEVVEINEAFAVQVLACLDALASPAFAARELGRSRAVGAIDEERLNVHGGAIALGHPVGASGARVLLAAARELLRRRARFAVAALCVGGGQGQAVILEAVA